MRRSMVFVAMATLAFAATAGGGARWKPEMELIKASQVKSLDPVALGAVDVRVGTHLERLTLLSGEGHMGKKIGGGIMAVALGAMGANGVDTASREPLEEHLTQDDAKKIADEVAQSIQQRLGNAGIKLIAGEAVTGTPAYQSTHAGATGVDKQTMTVKTGRFSPEYFFGIWTQPAGGYAYRGPKGGIANKFGFGGQGPLWGDKTFSPAVRAAVGAQALATVDVFLVNTRKQFRVQEMKVRVLGPMRAGGTDNILLSYVLDNADELAVPANGNDKDNYVLWQALRPAFEAKLDEVAGKIAGSTR